MTQPTFKQLGGAGALTPGNQDDTPHAQGSAAAPRRHSFHWNVQYLRKSFKQLVGRLGGVGSFKSLGGVGSGNFGHAGRPGEVGGSAEGGGGGALTDHYVRTPKLASQKGGKVPMRNGQAVPVVRKVLYHMTTPEAAEKILKQGFDLSKVRPRWRNDYAVSTGKSKSSLRGYFSGDKGRVMLEIKASGRIYSRKQDSSILADGDSKAYTRTMISLGWDMADAGNVYIYNPDCIESIKVVTPHSPKANSFKSLEIGGSHE